MSTQITNRQRTFGSFALFLTAAIWGLAFVAQKTGMDSLEPMLFNASRSFIGVIALMFFLPLLDRLSGHSPSVWGQCSSSARRMTLLLGGICCGCVLAAASILQQIGIKYTSVGKSGFLTALYIVLVPIAGLFLKRKCQWNMWVSAIIAIVGTYILCGTSSESFNYGDLWVIGSAFVYTMHIMVIDYFAPRTDCVRMSCLQFLVAGIISLAAGLIFGERASWHNITQAYIAILYCGLGSSAIAYTLQIVGQKYVHPAVASLLMSLESVFSVIGGWLFLNQKLTALELTGCAIIFAAVLLAQAPIGQKNQASN